LGSWFLKYQPLGIDQAFHDFGQVARAFNVVYGLQLSTRGEMEYAYQAERLTPSLCGRMVR